MLRRFSFTLAVLWCAAGAVQSLSAAEVPAAEQPFVSGRGQIHNSLIRFAKDKQGHVAFLGGSITEMEGYRPRICSWLQQRFPDTEFTFTTAGISSTCSNTGAFRLSRDVTSHGPVDLLFVEFAVNDDQDAMHSADGCVQGMEGIVRAVRRHNPYADIVMTHFINPGMLETLAAGQTILSASQHERVAEHYELSSVFLSKIVAAKIQEGSLTWEEFGGTHPGPVGNQLAADLAVSILVTGWKDLNLDNLRPVAHPMPDAPLLPSNFGNGKLLPLESARISDGWKMSEPDWKNIAGSKRSRFVGIPLLHTNTPGAMLQFIFSGSAVGAFVVAGPDAGQLEFQIDDGPWQTAELYHHYSKGLHYPRTVVFASDLPDKHHSVNVRLAASHHADSQGTAARVLHFVVNESR